LATPLDIFLPRDNCNGGSSFSKIAGFDECWAIGFGKVASSSQGYPTIFVYGRYNGAWGLFRSVNQGSTWVKCTTYVLDRVNAVNDITGDPDVFGKVYVAMGATGFAYGTTTDQGGGGGTVAVTGVTVSPTTASVVAGSTTTLTATVAPSNATNQNVSWSSSNTGVATVSSTGVVTGVAAGSATITVTTQDGGRTATCAITVTSANVAVTGVTVSPTTASVVAGSTTTLTATVVPSNATNQNVSWSSSNTGVATISSTGVVTGVAAGSATITVTTQDGARTATCSVTVTASGGGSSLMIYDDALANGWSAFSWGTTFNLAATAPVYAGARSISVTFTGAWGALNLEKSTAQATAGYDRIRLWMNTNGGATRNVQIVAINGSGVESGRRTVAVTNGWNQYDILFSQVGNPSSIKQIYIHDGTGAPQSAIFVDNIQLVGSGGGGTVAVTGVTVSPTTASVVAGSTTTLTATVAPANATNQNVTWSSSNTAVATVSSTGVVTGVAAGSATITVTTQDGGRTATCAVTVTASGGGSSLMIYDDALASGWSAFSWSTTFNLAATAPVYAGARSISVTFTGAWGALNLEKSTAQATAGYDRIRLWMNTNGGATRNVQIVVINGSGVESGRRTVAVTNGWNQYDILFSQVGNPSSIKQIYIHDGTGSAQSAIFVDNIRLTNGAVNLQDSGDGSAHRMIAKKPAAELRIYPNPTSNQLNVDFNLDKSSEAASTEMFDLLGRKVLQKGLEVNAGANYHTLSVSSLPTGTYLLHLRLDQEITVQKVVIE
jgi:uncharacterized protein YjdB